MARISYLTTLILLFTNLKESQCKCYQSFTTYCETISDLFSTHETKKTTRLVIGDENNNNNNKLISIDSKTIPLDQMDKLTTLVIINTISDIKNNAFIFTKNRRLEKFQLYKNKISRLRANTFVNATLNKLTLSYNDIEYVHKEVFSGCKLKTIDLSHNKLESIEPGVYDKGSFLSNITKEMIFSHNEIAHVEPMAFPSSLEILNLDHNKITVFYLTALKNLGNLQELTVSHNVIIDLYDLIDHLKELRVFDVSYNKLSAFRMKNINRLEKLQVLDLSHNRLDWKSDLTLLTLPKTRRILQISLAFNWYRDLDLNVQNLKGHYLILYGNPWNCKCWEKMEKFMVDNRFKRNKCDVEFFGHGSKPYCAYYEGNPKCDNNVKEKFFFEKDLEFFLKTIDGERYINCTLQVQLL